MTTQPTSISPMSPENTATEEAGDLPVPVRSAGGSPLDLPAEIFAAGLQRRKQNRAALMDWIREALVEGTDYGRIHAVSKDKCEAVRRGRMQDCKVDSHWSKPSLFKPGAEKICGMLGVTPTFPTLSAYEEAALNGVDIKAIVLRCEIVDGQGRIVASGVGARAVEKDYGDLNKSLKMAAKSAHIDATLRLGGLSEVFTQDIEDMPGTTEPATPTKAAAPGAKAKPEQSAPPTQAETKPLPPKAILLLERVRQAGAFEEARVYAKGRFQEPVLGRVLAEIDRIAAERKRQSAGPAEPPKAQVKTGARRSTAA